MNPPEHEILSYASRSDTGQRNLFALVQPYVVPALGVLFVAACLVPSFFRTTCCLQESDLVRAAMGDNGPFATAIKAFHHTTGHYPARLKDLVIKPVGETNWKGPYIEDLRKLDDPWDNSYQYRRPGLKSQPYDLWSMGPDRTNGTADDITG